MHPGYWVNAAQTPCSGMNIMRERNVQGRLGEDFKVFEVKYLAARPNGVVEIITASAGDSHVLLVYGDTLALGGRFYQEYQIFSGRMLKVQKSPPCLSLIHLDDITARRALVLPLQWLTGPHWPRQVKGLSMSEPTRN